MTAWFVLLFLPLAAFGHLCERTEKLGISPSIPIGTLHLTYDTQQLKLSLKGDANWYFTRTEIYFGTEAPSLEGTYHQFDRVEEFDPGERSLEYLIPFEGVVCGETTVYVSVHFGGFREVLYGIEKSTGWMYGNHYFDSSWGSFISFKVDCDCYFKPNLTSTDLNSLIYNIKSESISTGCAMNNGTIVLFSSYPEERNTLSLPLVGGEYYIRAVDNDFLFIVDFKHASFKLVNISIWLGDPEKWQAPFLVAENNWRELVLDKTATSLRYGDGHLQEDFSMVVISGEDLPFYPCGFMLCAIEVEVVGKENVHFHGFGIAPDGKNMISLSHCCLENKPTFPENLPSTIGCTFPLSFWRYAHFFQKQLNWSFNGINETICEQSWIDILEQTPNDPFTFLAQEYIAASLNMAQGADHKKISIVLEDVYAILYENCLDIDFFPDSIYTLQQLTTTLSDFNNGQLETPSCTYASFPHISYALPNMVFAVPAIQSFPPPPSTPILPHIVGCIIGTQNYSDSPTRDENTPCHPRTSHMIVRMYQGQALIGNDTFLVGSLSAYYKNEGIKLNFLRNLQYIGSVGGNASNGTGDGDFISTLKFVELWIWIGSAEVPTDENGFLYASAVHQRNNLEDRAENWEVVIPTDNLSYTCNGILSIYAQLFIRDQTNSIGMIATSHLKDYVLCCDIDYYPSPPLPWPVIHPNPTYCSNHFLYYKDHHPLTQNYLQRLSWGKYDFHLCNKKWMAILDHVPTMEDLKWTILAQQWITAKLNINQGVTSEEIVSSIKEARVLLEGCDTAGHLVNKSYVKDIIKQFVRFNYAYEPSLKMCQQSYSCTCYQLHQGLNIHALRVHQKQTICYFPPATEHSLTISLSSPSLPHLLLVHPQGLHYTEGHPSTLTLPTSAHPIHIHWLSPLLSDQLGLLHLNVSIHAPPADIIIEGSWLVIGALVFGGIFTVIGIYLKCRKTEPIYKSPIKRRIEQ